MVAKKEKSLNIASNFFNLKLVNLLKMVKNTEGVILGFKKNSSPKQHFGLPKSLLCQVSYGELMSFKKNI